MRQFVAKRRRSDGVLRAVECFDEGEHLEASVCAELAEAEGLEARVFLGADLVDVAHSSPAWFAEPSTEREAA